MRHGQDQRQDPHFASADTAPAYDDTGDEAPRRRGVRRWIALSVAAVAVFGFGAIVAYGYFSYADRHALAPAPLVAADSRPIRAKPENDGGLQVPHQGMSIFDAGQGARQTGAARGPETLLPPPETPLPKPAPMPVQAPVAQTITVAARPDMPLPAPASAEPAAPARPAAALLPPPPPPPPAPGRSASVAAPGAVATGAGAVPRPGSSGSAAAPTASAAPAATTPAAAVPAAAGAQARANAFRIQVGAMRTEAEARTAWDQVRRKHPDLLAGMAPSFARVELGERGSFYRIQAGPLPSRDAARGACERLTKAGTVCFVVPPA